MKKRLFSITLLLCICTAALFSCKEKSSAPSKDQIDAIGLKKGQIVLCGSPEKHFGSVEFEISDTGKIKNDFNLALALLHSFEYDEAEKAFAAIIDKHPNCAMAYWGVAMCNYHPLWTPPTEAELKIGAKAAEIAGSIKPKSNRETEYIDAISSFYQNWQQSDHHTRSLNFEKGMAKVYKDFPEDKEATIFYALALDAAADPTDKTFKKQKQAGALLYSLYPNEPNHPGIAHYIIHTYDYSGLAIQALPMARRYASIAPSSAHALHMPSHIFTRLGLWNEAINSNLASVSSARCYAPAAGIKGHWDEELHGLDYLVYAYLQKGENKLAKQQCDYLNTITEVHPVNFKVAYAFAAIPARYVIENQLWDKAAKLNPNPANLPWKNFPWQAAIIHFARLLGDVHLGNIAPANHELAKLTALHDTLANQKDAYKANQVQIQITAAKAWIGFKTGKINDALTLMNQAADMEDKTEKHPVTPCELIPARELLGDMLLQMNKPREALTAYQADLKTHPNRFNGTCGAVMAARKAGDEKTARSYYRQLLTFAKPDSSDKPEISHLKTLAAGY